MPEHQVALKLLHDDPTEEEELEFAREAIVTAQFDHPNVIKSCFYIDSVEIELKLSLRCVGRGSH